MPDLGSHTPLLLIAVTLGFCWASIMGNPYIILAGSIPPERTGVYMGIFNMMIVIPMLINGVTFGWIYNHLLGADPRNALTFAGALLVMGAITMLRVPDPRRAAGLAAA
jgi:maltose/moltooligosaccharide transporter